MHFKIITTYSIGQTLGYKKAALADPFMPKRPRKKMQSWLIVLIIIMIISMIIALLIFPGNPRWLNIDQVAFFL
jgi:t-SNARE complex subunit (syntaxin)